MYMAKRGGVWVDERTYYERNKDNVVDLAQFNTNQQKSSKPTSPNTRWCSFDYSSKTLTIQLNSGQLISLTFNKKNQSDKVGSQALLFEVGFDLWEAGITEVSRQEILDRCTKKANKYSLTITPNVYWLKNTRANLRRTIENRHLDGYLQAFDPLDRDKDTYLFSITKS